MNPKRTVLLAVSLAALAASAGAASARPAPRGADSATPSSTVTKRVGVDIADADGDVAKPKLDIQKVRVRNTVDQLKVRVYYPGVAKTYDFPLGYLSIWLDTDADRRGPEYGHFMQFWSDYRFAQTKGWRELLSPEWSHSPDGQCVEYAGLRSDKQSKLRWFEYIVQKTEGCFQAGDVRVAVSTVNEGENLPYQTFARSYADHLGKRHSWTEWIPVS